MVLLTKSSVILVVAIATTTAQDLLPSRPRPKLFVQAPIALREPVAVSVPAALDDVQPVFAPVAVNKQDATTPQAAKHAVPEQASLPEPVPIPPMNPEDLPAEVPRVSYRAGQLSVDTDNSTLSEVLNAIGKEIGAQIDAPPAVDHERVAAHLSGAPRKVLSALLDDGKFGYAILGPAEDPTGVQRVVLSSQSPIDANPKAPQAIQSARIPVYSHSEYSSVPSNLTGGDVARNDIAAPVEPVTPNAQLMGNIDHAAKQIAEATGHVPANPNGDSQPVPDAPPAESVNAPPTQPAEDKQPMQVLQDLYKVRQQLQRQQNQAQQPQQDQ